MNQTLKIYLNKKLQLGLGQLGGIYKVLDEDRNSFDQDKVVKIILKNPQVPKQFLTRKQHLRFVVDFDKLKNINHQNCVKILEHQEFNAHTLLLMQNYDYNLLTYAQKNKFEFQVSEYLCILNQVVSAYLNLIELGIQYGRFKPQNILVSQKIKEKTQFYLADYGFKMIDNDRSETDLCLQVPQLYASEEQDDIYQFGICIAQMGINYKMDFKEQLDTFHKSLKFEEFKKFDFENTLQQAVEFRQIPIKNIKLPPLILFILNSMIVYNSSQRFSWKDLMSLLQCIKLANPIKLNKIFENNSNAFRQEIIDKILQSSKIPRQIGNQQQQVPNQQKFQIGQQVKYQFQRIK